MITDSFQTIALDRQDNSVQMLNMLDADKLIFKA